MTLRISLRQPEYPVAVAACGSVALAAERVNVRSASNSASITRLEARFGLQLFIRCQAQADQIPDGQRRVPGQPRRTVQEFLDHAGTSVTEAHLTGVAA